MERDLLLSEAEDVVPVIRSHSEMITAAVALHRTSVIQDTVWIISDSWEKWNNHIFKVCYGQTKLCGHKPWENYLRTEHPCTQIAHQGARSASPCSTCCRLVLLALPWFVMEQRSWTSATLCTGKELQKAQPDAACHWQRPKNYFVPSVPKPHGVNN